MIANLVSVIIPCYNTAIYIEEAINSVLCSSYKNFEIIVINDGSDNIESSQILFNMRGSLITVYHQDNQGLASARNFGFEKSSGEYILFLDSDNRIKKDYIEKALKVFNKNPLIDVIYSLPDFFGENEPARFSPIHFSFDSLLAGNYIDACSFVRRTAFIKVGGFSVHEFLKGWDDWDLWIRLAVNKSGFFLIEEKLFDYRVRSDSMMGSADKEKRFRLMQYLGSKHGFVIHQRYRQYYRVMKKIQERPFSYFFRILYYKYILKKSLLD